MLPIELETFQLCPLICKSLRLMDQGFKGLYLLTTSSCSHQKVSPEIFQLKHEYNNDLNFFNTLKFASTFKYSVQVSQTKLILLLNIVSPLDCGSCKKSSQAL